MVNVVERFQNKRHPSFSLSGNERNQLFLNIDKDHFKSVAPLSGANHTADGRAFARIDFDRDGYIDFAVANANYPLFFLLRNELGENLPELANHHLVAIRLVGGNQSAEPSSTVSNRDGIGARVWVTTASDKQVKEKHVGEGFAAQNSDLLHFGIGRCDSIKEIKIRWPSGREQTISDLPIDSLVTLYEDPTLSPNQTAHTTEPYHVKRESVPGPGAPMEKQHLAAQPTQTATLRLYLGMSTTCPACRKELPHLARLRKLFDDSELDILAIPLDKADGEEELARFQSEHRPAYHLTTDSATDARLAMEQILNKQLYGSGYPASVITNQNNEVLFVTWGTPTISKLRQLLDE